MSRGPSLISGCSGFLGTNALRLTTSRAVVGLDLVPPSAPVAQFLSCDIRNLESCEGARAVAPSTVLHLASAGETLSPFSELGALYETNVTGTWNILRVFDPDLVVLASCSSIYGNTEGAAGVANRAIRPLSSFAMSKLAAESVCRDWAQSHQRGAVILRMGKVIGPGCRGLIPYLVNHAMQYPSGAERAQLRGGGNLIRDYLPMKTAVRALWSAAGRTWRPGVHIVNVSSGRGVSNRRIYDLVRAELRKAGLRLEGEWSDEPGPGESWSTILDPESMETTLGITRPSEEEVTKAAEDSVRAMLAEFEEQGLLGSSQTVRA